MGVYPSTSILAGRKPAKIANMYMFALLASQKSMQHGHFLTFNMLNLCFEFVIINLVQRRHNPMELRVLKYFLMVAREENITKAAALLHLTQPTLSRHL